MKKRSHPLLTGFFLTGWVALVAGASLAATEVEILLRPAAGEIPGEAAPAEVTVEPLDSPPPIETIDLEAGWEEPVRLRLPEDRTYRLSARLPGFYVPERVFRTEGEAQDLSVSLFPTGILIGSVRVGSDGKQPESLEVTFSEAPESGPSGGTDVQVPSGELDCPIEEGEFRCEVPAGALDLRLRSRQHISHYLWDVKVERGRELELGELLLRRGASIIGWVLPPSRDLDFRRVEVTASPQLMGGVASRADLERRSLVERQASVNHRGFFELTALPPGSYVVEVSHPGYATTTVAPVTVLQYAETELRSIELQPPATLEVEVWPPRHPLSRWVVALHQKSPVPGYSDQVEKSMASEEGRWKVSDLEPGRYFLRISDNRGSNWAHEDVEVTPGMAPVEIRLPMMRLEGEVVYDGEPLEADLYFGGLHGARNVEIRSDEEGKFYAFIPERDSWFVDVSSSRPKIDTRVEDLQFRQGPDDRWAKTRIEVPKTELSGQVVDPAGQPVPGARVRASGPSHRGPSVETDSPEGRFEFLGLQEGTWHLEASFVDADSGERSSSRRLEVRLHDGEELTSLRLVLVEQRRVLGAVLGPDGQGVPGASVLTFPIANGVRASDRLPTETTDVEGTFELWLPAWSDEVLLTVFPPGFSVTQARVDLESEAPLLIPVDDIGGTLEVTYESELDEGSSPKVRRVRTLIFAAGSLLDSQALESWARAHGQEQPADGFVVPRLAPGLYVACLEPDAGPFMTGEPPAEAERCASGTLPPFGTLELHLAAPARSTSKSTEARTVGAPSR